MSHRPAPFALSRLQLGNGASVRSMQGDGVIVYFACRRSNVAKSARDRYQTLRSEGVFSGRTMFDNVSKTQLGRCYNMFGRENQKASDFLLHISDQTTT
jgi:hypothetical protein